MADLDDLEFHNEIIGRTLAELASRGLRRQDLSFSVVLPTSNDEFSSHTSYEIDDMFIDVVKWMEREGLVAIGQMFGDDGETIISDMQLTARGLELVQMPLAALENRTISDVSKDTELSSSVYTKIGNLVGGFIGSLAKSV